MFGTVTVTKSKLNHTNTHMQDEHTKLCIEQASPVKNLTEQSKQLISLEAYRDTVV